MSRLGREMIRQAGHRLSPTGNLLDRVQLYKNRISRPWGFRETRRAGQNRPTTPQPPLKPQENTQNPPANTTPALASTSVLAHNSTPETSHQPPQHPLRSCHPTCPGPIAKSPPGSTKCCHPHAWRNSNSRSAPTKHSSKKSLPSSAAGIREATRSAKSGNAPDCPAPHAQNSATTSCKPSHQNTPTTSNSTCPPSAADCARPTSPTSKNSPHSNPRPTPAAAASSNPPPDSSDPTAPKITSTPADHALAPPPAFPARRLRTRKEQRSPFFDYEHEHERT